MGPIQASLKHLLRSEFEPDAERVSRAKDLVKSCKDGVGALRELEGSERILHPGSDWTYGDLYKNLLSLFTPGIERTQTLLVGVYHDPAAIMRDNSLEAGPHLINTRYQYHLSSMSAGNQAYPLIREDTRMLELLGLSPQFRYYLEPIMGGRVFRDQSGKLEIAKLPELRLVSIRGPLTW